MRLPKFALLLAAFGLAAVACGGSDELADSANPDAAGTCLAGAADCADNPQPLPGEVPTDGEPAGFLTVGEVVGTSIDGGFAIRGYYFETAEGSFICDAIAESFPPQCGGARLPLDNSAGGDIGELQTEGSVTWSNEQVTIIGEVIDGVFVVMPASD
jgi:hypothetical protein